MSAPRVNSGTGRGRFHDEGYTETFRSLHRFPEALQPPIALSNVELYGALRRCSCRSSVHGGLQTGHATGALSVPSVRWPTIWIKKTGRRRPSFLLLNPRVRLPLTLTAICTVADSYRSRASLRLPQCVLPDVTPTALAPRLGLPAVDYPELAPPI
jgi:hypothetical protein